MLGALFLYAMLADPHWEVREYAGRRLTRAAGMDAAVGAAVEVWARAAASPEVAHRSRRAVNAYRNRLAWEYTPATAPVWPCADFWPAAGSCGDVRDRAAWQSWGVPCRQSAGFPAWTHYRRATEDHVRQLIREGMGTAEADELVRRMWALEVAHDRDAGPAARPVMATWTSWQGGYPGCNADAAGSPAR